MNDSNKTSLVLILGIGLMVSLVFVLPQPKPTKIIQMTSVIDSTWSKSPGKENTLQIETIYFGRTKDSVVHRRKQIPFIKGEKVKYIFKQTK